jgi:hypothetical protein
MQQILFLYDCILNQIFNRFEVNRRIKSNTYWFAGVTKQLETT